MGLYIRGMEMPKNCDVCPLIAEADDYHVCYINEQFIPWEWVGEHSSEQRHPKPSWCPLVEIPPHGRLIDADVLMENEENISFKDEWHMTVTEAFVSVKNIAHAPTIIEAEEGET